MTGRRTQRAAQTAVDITIGLLVCALAAIVLVGWWT